MRQSPFSLMADASVVVKWVLAEEFPAEARELLADGLRPNCRLVGPPLLIPEVTIALYQRYRRQDLTEAEVDAFVAHIWNRPVTILSPPDLTERTYWFVRRHRLANVYDIDV